VKTVLFAHGKESGPQGTKINALSQVALAHGWQPLAPDFQGMDDPQARVAKLLGVAARLSGPLVLVGSSMGGYVMAEASRQLQPAAMLLLAPAVGIPFYPNPDPQPVAGQLLAVHGWQDEIIPDELVIAWCRRHRVPLQLVDDNHALTGSLPLLERRLAALLRGTVPKPERPIPIFG
jgi:alpha-beta hydrolase superfamily lysophospholipase